jgi:isoquinoline 1-oxidoreductase beta subunit
MTATTLSRRSLLAGSAGLTFALTLSGAGFGSVRALAAEAAAPGAAKSLGAWVSIAADGAITIAVPAEEMGQGSLTAMAMVFAEELDADWAHVSTTHVPPRADIYGNPAFGGALTTVGSKSIQGYWDKVRLQAAAVRRVLMLAAAKSWDVPLAELTTEPSAVVHAASNRRMSYGEIAATAEVPAEMPRVEKADLKPTAAYRIIGHTTPRIDVPAKTDGTAMYGMDVQIPGMVYGTILKGPVEGSAIQTLDSAAAEKIPGVLKVLNLKDAVGIVANSVEAAFGARTALEVVWTKPEFASYDSDAALKQFVERGKKMDDKGLPYVAAGDVGKAFAAAAKTVSADYTTDYVYHAQMEPINVTAHVNDAGDGVEIWMGTQSQSAVLGASMAILKTTADKVKINTYYLGGGFGRRSSVDMMGYVFAMSKAMKKPVKMIWTREQDLKAAKMRPMTAHRMEAALSASGEVTAWRHRIVAESIVAYSAPQRLEQSKGLDPLTLEGAKINYEIPNQAIDYLREIRGAPLSAWRGIGAGHNKFAIEGFADEIASAVGVDAVKFRLQLVRSNPRAIKVIETVAKSANWGTKPAAGSAFGFAFGQIVDTWVAVIVEVSLDRETGEVRSPRVWVALDPGIVINPDTVLAQTEGNVVFGLSQVLRERVSLTDGRVQQTNLFDYRVGRMSDTPDIHIDVISTDNPPTGMGEAALPLIGPAVANGLFALTGHRFRNMPINPPRVKAVLSGNGEA